MSAPLRLRNGELLEELARRAGDPARPRPSAGAARRCVVASSFRAFAVDVAAAFEEPAHGRKLLGRVIALVSQGALEPPVGGGIDRHAARGDSTPARCSRTTSAAGDDVAEPLVLAA